MSREIAEIQKLQNRIAALEASANKDSGKPKPSKNSNKTPDNSHLITECFKLVAKSAKDGVIKTGFTLPKNAVLCDILVNVENGDSGLYLSLGTEEYPDGLMEHIPVENTGVEGYRLTEKPQKDYQGKKLQFLVNNADDVDDFEVYVTVIVVKLK